MLTLLCARVSCGPREEGPWGSHQHNRQITFGFQSVDKLLWDQFCGVHQSTHHTPEHRLHVWQTVLINLFQNAKILEEKKISPLRLDFTLYLARIQKIFELG